MVRETDKHPSVLRSIDWWTIAIYVALLAFGWLSVCGASYTYGETDIFSLTTNSGKQIMWIGTSLMLGLVLLLLDDRFYDTFAYIIYIGLVLLLFATIFNPVSTKGSHSWLVLGPVKLQPAEFAKFATALAVSKFMSSYGFDMKNWKHFAAACAIVIIPMICIVGQRETGSALVYLSFFLMFYREGMPGSILFTGVAMVIYFVVGIRFADTLFLYSSTSVGKFTVLLLIQLFSGGLVLSYCRNHREAFRILAVTLSITLAAILFSAFVIPFDVTYVELAMCVILIAYLVWQSLVTRIRNYLWIALFALGSVIFFNLADYVLNNVMEPHQRVRINVLLGLEEDLKGAGYNVHQSEIAIGSGGLEGKGFLNGTQTKLKYVPEQHTDFIFCTIGEEQGFVGSVAVLLLFLVLILRIITLAERNHSTFARVYAYCVASYLIFHLAINIGMVIGLCPVIGIPLPFFSYGGSSLWGFTFLLFILLRIDADRGNYGSW